MSIVALGQWLTQGRKLGRLIREPRAWPIRPTLETLEHREVPSTLVVTNLDDTGVSGDGSLRGMIRAAAPFGDQIVFDPSLAGQTITLTSGTPLFIDKFLAIQGLGAERLTVSGNATTEVFFIAAGMLSTITGLTIANGNAGTGGGITNTGTLTLDAVTLASNFGSLGGGIYNLGFLTANAVTLTGNSGSLGGGIYNAGTLTLTLATLSQNRGTYGGGIYNDGSLALDSSTVTGNSAFFGGGIYNGGTAEMTVTSSTVSSNSATIYGGGIFNSGTLTLTLSMLLGNTPDHIFGDYTDGGDNRFG